MPDYILGVDVAYYQSYATDYGKWWFNPSVGKPLGLSFGMIRASHGLTKDPEVEKFAKLFESAGIPYGFYHYAEPWYTYDKQVDFFAEIISDLNYDLPPTLDLEKEGCYLSFAKNFLGRLGTKTGKKPMLYTSGGYWGGLIGHENATWALDYYLWWAQYPYTNGGVRGIPDKIRDGSPDLKEPFKDWDFWQFTAYGDGEYFGGDYDKRYENKATLDLNVHNGGIIDMYEKFAIGTEPEQPEDPIIVDPQPEPDPALGKVRVIARQSNSAPGWLMFRDSPDFDYQEVLAVGFGTELQLMEAEPVNGLWHVETPRGREGYVSAGSAYTEKA